MHFIATMFFLTVLSAAFWLIHAMFSEYRKQFVDALFGREVSQSAHLVSVSYNARHRRLAPAKAPALAPVSLPLAA